jgi:hypothetical protein
MAVMVVEIQLFPEVVGNGNRSGRILLVRDHFSENGWRG